MESSCPKYNSVIKTCNFFLPKLDPVILPRSLLLSPAIINGKRICWFFFLQLEQDLLRRLSVKFAAICSNRPLNSRYNYLKFPQNKPQVRDGLIRLLSLFLNHLYVSSTVLGHTETLSNCLLYRLKTIPREKKREPKPQSQRSRKLGKKTNKKNRDIEKERVITRNIQTGVGPCVGKTLLRPRKQKALFRNLPTKFLFLLLPISSYACY